MAHFYQIGKEFYKALRHEVAGWPRRHYTLGHYEYPYDSWYSWTDKKTGERRYSSNIPRWARVTVMIEGQKSLPWEKRKHTYQSYYICPRLRGNLSAMTRYGDEKEAEIFEPIGSYWRVIGCAKETENVLENKQAKANTKNARVPQVLDSWYICQFTHGLHYMWRYDYDPKHLWRFLKDEVQYFGRSANQIVKDWKGKFKHFKKEAFYSRNRKAAYDTMDNIFDNLYLTPKYDKEEEYWPEANLYHLVMKNAYPDLSDIKPPEKWRAPIEMMFFWLNVAERYKDYLLSVAVATLYLRKYLAWNAWPRIYKYTEENPNEIVTQFIKAYLYTFSQSHTKKPKEQREPFGIPKDIAFIDGVDFEPVYRQLADHIYNFGPIPEKLPQPWIEFVGSDNTPFSPRDLALCLLYMHEIVVERISANIAVRGLTREIEEDAGYTLKGWHEVPFGTDNVITFSPHLVRDNQYYYQLVTNTHPFFRIVNTSIIFDDDEEINEYTNRYVFPQLFGLSPLNRWYKITKYKYHVNPTFPWEPGYGFSRIIYKPHLQPVPLLCLRHTNENRNPWTLTEEDFEPDKKHIIDFPKDLFNNLFRGQLPENSNIIELGDYVTIEPKPDDMKTWVLFFTTIMYDNAFWMGNRIPNYEIKDLMGQRLQLDEVLQWEYVGLPKITNGVDELDYDLDNHPAHVLEKIRVRCEQWKNDTMKAIDN